MEFNVKRITPMEIARAKESPAVFKPDFIAWLADNLHIYQEFEKRALQVAQHRKHYSARTIVEVMRHDSAIGQLDGGFKINDRHTPDMARLFAMLNPMQAGLFEFRREKATVERRAAA